MADPTSIPMPEYSPVERYAAEIIASLIYTDWPGDPLLGRDLTKCGIYTEPIALLYQLYDQVTQVMIQKGEALDATPMAADLWEAYRNNSTEETPYARIDPLLRTFSISARRLWEAEQRKNGVAPAPVAPKDYVVDWRSQGITLAALQHKDFPPERWIVENIYPEGACLVAAKYKSKKSWLALALHLAIAMGGKALGRLDVVQGRVLYLDLEGRQQRIKKRVRAMLGVQQVDWPENFHVFEKWPSGEEGIRELENWFASYPDTVSTVIDVLADFRRPMDKGEMPYMYDRATVQPLNEFFEHYHAGCMLVHHFNKAKNDDIMDSISGTTGLPSAVNTLWGLSRDVNDSSITVLHLRGRDLENDEPIALRWDTYLNQHVIEGPANEVAISTERKAILALLSDDEPRTPKDIAIELSRPVETVKQLLRKLLNDGVIDKPAYGKYARVAKHDHSDHSDHSGTSDHSIHSRGESDRKSDRYTPRVIPPDHSVLTQQDAPNGKSDQSDRDVIGRGINREAARSLPERLKQRGEPRILTGDALQEAMKDSDDTTFSQFTGLPVEEDDHAIEGQE